MNLIRPFVKLFNLWVIIADSLLLTSELQSEYWHWQSSTCTALWDTWGYLKVFLQSNRFHEVCWEVSTQFLRLVVVNVTCLQEVWCLEMTRPRIIGRTIVHLPTIIIRVCKLRTKRSLVGCWETMRSRCIDRGGQIVRTTLRMSSQVRCQILKQFESKMQFWKLAQKMIMKD